MRNIDSYSHTRGESIYLDDIPVINGTLYAAVYGSPLAHGKILSLHLAEALKCEGVVRIFTHADIPGMNQIGGIVPDEPLLADGTVDFAGMPVALVIAKSEKAAQHALTKIKIELDPLPVVTDPRVAKENNSLIVPPRTFRIGNSGRSFQRL